MRRWEPRFVAGLVDACFEGLAATFVAKFFGIQRDTKVGRIVR